MARARCPSGLRAVVRPPAMTKFSLSKTRCSTSRSLFTDATADHERASHLMIALIVRLDVARERLDTALAESRDG